MPKDDELRRLRDENAKLLEAVRAAYDHLDTYGAVHGHEREMASQRKVFDLLRPFRWRRQVTG